MIGRYIDIESGGVVQSSSSVAPDIMKSSIPRPFNSDFMGASGHDFVCHMTCDILYALTVHMQLLGV